MPRETNSFIEIKAPRIILSQASASVSKKSLKKKEGNIELATLHVENNKPESSTSQSSLKVDENDAAAHKLQVEETNSRRVSIKTDDDPEMPTKPTEGVDTHNKVRKATPKRGSRASLGSTFSTGSALKKNFRLRIVYRVFLIIGVVSLVVLLVISSVMSMMPGNHIHFDVGMCCVRKIV